MNDKTIDTEVTMRDTAPAGGAKRFRPGDEILGRYVVKSELGQGGMGVVYLCQDKVVDVEVAVKGLPPDVSRNRDEMEEIRENFRQVCDLRHPGIAAVRTLERDAAGDCYLVMDVARGTNLGRWMRTHRNDRALDAKLALLAEIASALDYAHSRRVAHRDMKPENVMVDDDGHVQIIDFGFAACVLNRESRGGQQMTSARSTLGCKSPEQWRGQPEGAAADQYALGVIAYQMISGEMPFDSDDLGILREAVLNEPMPEIEDVPSQVNAALARALAKEPAERFASCSDFVAVLAGGTASDGPRGPAAAKAASSPHRFPAGRALAAVLLAAAVGGGGFAAYRWLVVREERVRQEAEAVARAEAARQAEEAARQAELAARKEAETRVVRNAALELKALAGAAQEDALKRKFADYPELAEPLRSFNACYRSGVEAFASGDYAAATNFFERVGATMRSMSAEHRVLEAKRAEHQRLDEVRRKLGSGGYDAGKDEKGREIAVWVPNRVVNGRMTSEREGVWRTAVGCPDCAGAGAHVQNAVCSTCSGSCQVVGKVQCLQCQGKGKMQEHQVCSLCSGVGMTRPECTAGCSEITRRGQVLFQHGFVCSQCKGTGSVSNGAGLVGDLAGLAIGTAIAGKNYQPPPSSPTTVTCAQCGGLGAFQCGTCSGTGVVQKKCYACRGTGRSQRTTDCSACGGTGSCSRHMTCMSCRGGKVARRRTCERCLGNGRMWMEKADGMAGCLYFPMTVWSPVGAWQAEYVQTLQEPGRSANDTAVREKLDCRADGEFTRTRYMQGKEGTVSGKWSVQAGRLVLSIRKADGSFADSTYELVDRSQNSFELRFADVGDYERGLAAHGGKAVSRYADDGSLRTELTRGGKVTKIIQTAKVFKKEEK